MIISLIAAVARNRVIGKRGSLPWYLPADLKHFQEVTKGKSIIMGRKTYESIGKPLPDRRNIVLTRDRFYKQGGCIVVHSLADALEAAGRSDEVMVIGGEEIYHEFLPFADRMYLTLIDAGFLGDAFFPEFDKSEWEEKSRQDFQPDEENPLPYSFVVLERREQGDEPDETRRNPS
jgi:dihydrofolate reductase